jgi:hypothetical protein
MRHFEYQDQHRHEIHAAANVTSKNCRHTAFVGPVSEAQDCKPPYLLSLLAPQPTPRMDGSSKRIAASLKACIKHVRTNPAHT